MSLACWSILSMSSHDPRNHVGCSHWLGPSSPQATRIHTPSPSMPSAGNSTSSGVGSTELPTLFDITRQPYHQASTLIPDHQIYLVLISLLLVMALGNWCRVRLYFCKCNMFFFTLFFLRFVSHSLWCQREATLGEQTADLHTAPHRGHGQGTTVCGEYFHEDIFTAGHNVHFRSLHFCSFAEIS